jgi:hypothetical protein
MAVFYFTSTGNSLAGAKRIGGNLISIRQVIDEPGARYLDGQSWIKKGVLRLWCTR